jgi:hypothetical protein
MGLISNATSVLIITIRRTTTKRRKRIFSSPKVVLMMRIWMAMIILIIMMTKVAGIAGVDGVVGVLNTIPTWKMDGTFHNAPRSNISSTKDKSTRLVFYEQRMKVHVVRESFDMIKNGLVSN